MEPKYLFYKLAITNASKYYNICVIGSVSYLTPGLVRPWPVWLPAECRVFPWSG